MTFALFFAAVLPSLWIVHYFRQGDRFPEPASVVLATFVLGVLIAVPVLAAVFLFRSITEPPADPIVFAVYRSFMWAAVPEEVFKFLVLYFYCLRHDAFDEPMDGLVYGVTVSLGFAAIENVLYVSNGGWTVAITRAVTAVPSHGLYGAMMGYLIGWASFASRWRAGWIFLALSLPILAHGAWNSALHLAPTLGEQVLLALPALLVAQYIFVKLSWLHFDRIQRMSSSNGAEE